MFIAEPLVRSALFFPQQKGGLYRSGRAGGPGGAVREAFSPSRSPTRGHAPGPDMTRDAARAALASQGADAATVAEVMTLLGHADGRIHFSAPLAQAAQGLDDELREGDVLGAWTLQGPLGQGGMGRVFLAERSDGHTTPSARR